MIYSENPSLDFYSFKWLWSGDVEVGRENVVDKTPLF